MRRVAAIVAALVTVLAVATVAIAQSTNSYKVDASASPTKRGTKKKPQPVKVKFSYDVAGPNAQTQPDAVSKYKIDLYGVKSNGKLFPSCSLATFTAQPTDADCPAGSRVGSGTLRAIAYPTGNPSSTSTIPCTKQVRVYNSGANKAVIYLFGAASACGGLGTTFAFPATYVKGAGGGQALQFTVPTEEGGPLHPGPGLTVAVLHVDSTIKLTTKRVKKIRHGYYDSVGCLGSKRPVKVTFTTEAGALGSASTNATCSK